MTDERQIAIPGEVIGKGNDLLPGEWTEKRGEEIVALRYGLVEEANKLVKVIPLSGVYQARRGNVVIGKVDFITMNGWFVDIKGIENAFIPIMEIPKFVNKDAMEEVLEIGDLVIAKILRTGRRGVDLTLKLRGLGKIDEGLIIEVNPNKVPRVIGREGSMVNLIKERTDCDVTVGQNGLIWIQGETIDNELFAKEAINFIVENSFVSGLTEAVTKWFDKRKK